jgi:hypothetical protein
MEKTKAMKTLVILVTIALAGSIVAVGLVYNEDPDTTIVDPADILNRPASAFEYEIAFDANVIKELNSIRLAAETSVINKQEVDSAIQALDGVSRITSSSFRKIDADRWIYLAEIDLKRSTDISAGVQEILSLDSFNGDKEAMKRVSINIPQTVTVNNSDLNISRDFSFEYPTTFALASLTTLPGDIISVSGSITLQGQAVLALELLESANQTAQPEFFELSLPVELVSIEEGLFFEAATDQNVDQNTLEAQVKTIDSDAELIVFPFGETTSIALRSKGESLSELETLLSIYGGDFYQIGTFELENVFISELDSEVSLTPTTFQGQINTGHSTSDTIALSLTVSISRGTALIAQAIEN